MSKGRKKTPTAILVGRNSWVAKTRVNEIKVNPSQPECPAWLNEQAKEKFVELSKLLFNLGVMTDLDTGVVARYSDTFIWWLSCRDFIEKNGMTHEVENAAGKKKMQMYPQARLANQLSEILSKLEANFGLSPAARVGLKVSSSAAQADSDKRKFFRDGH